MMARTRVLGAVTRDSNYEVSTKKPLDARSLVKTYDDLLNINNWVNANGNPIVYNGMIVAVWLNTTDPSKNGIYFLHDATVTSAKGTPDVTKESNWHKLADVTDITVKLAAIDDSFENIENRLAALENGVEQEAQVTFAEYSQFPSIGESNKLYIALDEKASFIWDGDAYVRIGGETTDIDIKLINGGSALDN